MISSLIEEILNNHEKNIKNLVSKRVAKEHHSKISVKVHIQESSMCCCFTGILLF